MCPNVYNREIAQPGFRARTELNTVMSPSYHAVSGPDS